MSRLWIGPAGASLVHEAIREAWLTPYHQGFLDRWLADWMRQVGHDAAGGSTREQWKRHLWQGVRFAPLYVLEEGPSALIESAARSFNHQPLLETDLPGTAGFVLCEYPIPTIDVKEREYPMTGWMWTPGVDSQGQRGVVWCSFTSNQDVREPLRSAMPPLSLLHISFLPFGADPGLFEFVAARTKEPVSQRAMQNQRAILYFLQSFWSFVQQRVLTVATSTWPRAVRHRAAKANATLPALNVIRLRRPEYGPVQKSDAPKHVDWRYRWVVSGHWRRWWFESEGRTRQIWVHDYVKGPESKPLLKRKSLFAVER